jgi:hypothetical protein
MHTLSFQKIAIVTPVYSEELQQKKGLKYPIFLIPRPILLYLKPRQQAQSRAMTEHLHIAASSSK